MASKLLAMASNLEVMASNLNVLGLRNFNKDLKTILLLEDERRGR